MAGLALPHNLEAERSVLGAMLLSERSLYALIIEEGLRPHDFYAPRHQHIYSAMLALYARNEPLDTITVTEELRRTGHLEDAGGSEAVDELTAAVPLVGNARSYAQIVREASQRRQMLRVLHEAQEQALTASSPVGDVITDICGRLLDLRSGEEVVGSRKLSEIVTDVVERNARLAGLPAEEAFIGLPTGLIDLDHVLNGLRAGNTYVVGGRPSSGKTAFGLQIAFNTGAAGKTTLIASAEMSQEELGERRVANAARMDLNKVAQPSRLNKHDVDRLIQTAMNEGRVDAPIYVTDRPSMSLLDIRAEALEIRRRTGHLDLIVVDYIQLLSAVDARPGDSRATIVGQFSRGLKQLARELRVPILVLSQLSRASELRHDKRPTMADLRESGDIEQDASVVLLVHREDYYDPAERPGEVDLIVAKNRQGSREDVTLSFQRPFQRILDFAHG